MRSRHLPAAPPLVTAVTKPKSPVAQRAAVPPSRRPGRSTPGATADPDPALLEAAPSDPSGMLPRIVKDGRMPMQAFAAGFDPSNHRPHVGMLLAGIGLDQAESEAAIHDLPGGVTLAFSPYASGCSPCWHRATGRPRIPAVLPMEPQSYPLNDAGPAR